MQKQEIKQIKKNKSKKEKGITLIALVVTIVVLLILAGVSIVVLFGDNGILGTAGDATTKFAVEAEREKIENIRIDWWTKKIAGENVTVDKFFEMLQPQIIGDLSDVTGPDDNNNYIVETNSGYTVEVIVEGNGNIQIGEITKGSLGPKILNLKMLDTTATTITVKAEFLRAENATIKYEYKEESKNEYIDITKNVTNGVVTISDLLEGTTYDIKVSIVKDGKNVADKSIKAIARNITKVTKMILNRKQAMIGVGTTLNLTASIEPNNATIKELEWTSSNHAVAKVDSNGQVTTQKEGDVVITAKTTDGSELEATCDITVIKADGSFSEEKGVNIPKLGNGMMAIIWDENANEGQGDWVTPNSVNDWYKYSEEDKKWANAITEDGSMWVWVPRYGYQISTNYNKGGNLFGTINIKFLKGITNIAADGKNTWDNASKEENWNIHPGFEYDTTKPGLWIAKFQASRSDSTAGSYGNSETLRVVPSVSRWRGSTLDVIYTKCLEYNTNLNSHLTKNTEWGAVTYLAQSSYGANKQITNNIDERLTGGRKELLYHKETSNSTTANIYGVYDMAGGGSEYVAAYVNSKNDRYMKEYAISLIEGEDYTKDVYNSSNVYRDYLACAQNYDHGSIDEYSLAQHEKWAEELPCPVLRIDGTKTIEENALAVVEYYRSLFFS